MAVRDVIQAAAGVGGGEPLYVEDVFSTYLYTGNGTSQTITNGIDLAGEGGMVWMKARSNASSLSNVISDTERGIKYGLVTNSTSAQPSITGGNVDLYAFNSDGFSVGADNNFNVNTSGWTFASWTFRKAPKFFDVVTYTGNGVAGRTVAHDLGSVPGCIIVKSTSDTGGWSVYHRGLYPPAATGGTTAPENYVLLNTTAGVSSLSTVWNNTNPTSTQFTVGTNAAVNTSGQSYVAYVFAHNAGGFGESGEEDVITCGQYQGLGNGIGPVIDLGFEPQWLLVKAVKDSSNPSPNWYVIDNMRSWTEDGIVKDLSPNTSTAETSSGSIKLTATGFQPMGNDGSIYNERLVGYIYIAIRRPMKTPESGTEVFSVQTKGTLGAPAYNAGFPVDALFVRNNKNTTFNMQAWDRLRSTFSTTSTAAVEEAFSSGYLDYFDSNDGFDVAGGPDTNDIAWMFKRAPGFMDVVAYTGTGYSAATNGLAAKSHNLGVEPELIIVKARNSASYNWMVYHKYAGDPDHTATYGTRSVDKRIFLNLNSAASNDEELWGDETYPPNANEFRVRSNNSAVNASGTTYIAYLFASLPGVSKVSSYTGTGTTQTINCGFSSGARFVLIKRTDSTGDWYVWDSVRGIVAGNDPYLLLNSTAVEETTTDYIDPESSGFQISSSAPAAINASGGTFIYLAIA